MNDTIDNLLNIPYNMLQLNHKNAANAYNMASVVNSGFAKHQGIL